MKRNKFNLSHYRLLTCKMGQLVPLTWFEVLPGDTIQQATSGLIRCAPVVTPVMHPVRVRFHHFFVPNRILWTNFQNFITGGPLGTDTTQHPYVALSGTTVTVGSLMDYLGVSVNANLTLNINALPFRAYAMIWNEWFRDQDLQTLLTVNLGDGADSTTNTVLQNCCWEKDYLTSSRPWTSKGNAVSIPLQSGAISGHAPVVGIGQGGSPVAATNSWYDTTGALNSNQPAVNVTAASTFVASQATGAVGASNLPQIFANMTGAGSTVALTGGLDPIALRHGMAVMRYQEARAIYGSRYTEYLRAAFGVRSSDARLQRPEYLGGGRQTIQFSEVMQTGVTPPASGAGTPGGAGGIGQYGGHGISAMRSNRYRRFFEEHGIVMTLMSVVPRTMYANRMKRGWFRGIGTGTLAGMNGTKEDYWQREFEHIGQQAINSFEVDTIGSSNSIFGYQDRYDEYRREECLVAGQFRGNPNGFLDTWHLAREFASAPALNSTFVSCVPSARIFADTADDNLYCMINHSIQARRLVGRSGAQKFVR